MFSHYVKTAVRNLIRHKGYSTVSVLGLTLGICTSIVIYLIASYELSFDAFHPEKERIYRVMEDVIQSTGEKNHFARVPFSVPVLAPNELSGVDAFAGVMPYGSKISIPGANRPPKDFDGGAVIAQPSWFSVFSYQWLAGRVSADPFTVVLCESKARQYFGAAEPDKLLGRIVLYNSLPVRVSGIIKDWNNNTDFPFTDFIPFSTLQSALLSNTVNMDSWVPHDMPILAFVKLSKGTRPAKIDAQLAGFVKRHADPAIKLALRLEPLAEIHFNADVIENDIRTAHMPTLYLLMVIAGFILLIAAINFVNLSTAQSIRRSKEIGIRKVLGGSRTSVVLQFLVETLVLTIFAMVLAVSLVNPVLAAFRQFIPSGVVFHLSNPSTLIFLLGVTLVTTLLAGLYPAKALSAFYPASSLKGADAQKGSEKWYLRKGLIIFQFSVSLVFIVSSIVVADQLNYTRNKDLGFTSDAIVTVGTPWGDSLSKIRVLAEQVKHLSGVSGVAMEWVPPGNAAGMVIKFQGMAMKDTRVSQVDGNEDFIPLYQIKLLAGRNLQHADSVTEFVINENLSRLMGCKKPEDAIGKIVYWFDRPYPVVGVVADFHSQSLHAPITPLCIINRVEREGNLAVKLAATGKSSGHVKSTLTQMERIWKSIYPGATFSYQFYDESIARMYEKDQKAATLMNTAMLMTIFISCMGLFGLSMFSAEKMTKEIGIRKVLGASAAGIAIMMNKDFVVLVAIAIFIGSPIAWYAMNQWLEGFAYHINMSLWIIILAGGGAIVIALLTVSFETIKAASANPSKSLRTE